MFCEETGHVTPHEHACAQARTQLNSLASWPWQQSAGTWWSHWGSQKPGSQASHHGSTEALKTQKLNIIFFCAGLFTGNKNTNLYTVIQSIVCMSYYGFLDILIIDCALYNFAIQNFLNIGYIFKCITFYYNYTVILYIIYNYIILNII